MCIGSPRRSTPGLMVMCLCALVLSQLIIILVFNIHLTVLYCLCIYIRIPFLFEYFITFLVLFMQSIITIMSTPTTTPYLYSLSVCLDIH